MIENILRSKVYILFLYDYLKLIQFTSICSASDYCVQKKCLLVQVTRTYKAKEHAEIEFTVSVLSLEFGGRC